MPAPIMNPSAALLAQGGNPTQAPMPGGMGNAPLGAPPAPSMSAMNSAAMLGLQGGSPEIPPGYEVEVQPNGTLAIVEIDPTSGHKNVVKIVSVKRFGGEKGK